MPLAWDAAVTLTASYQKVFSDDPKLGFFAQREHFQEALDNGEVLAPAKNMDDMQQVVTNSTVDGDPRGALRRADHHRARRRRRGSGSRPSGARPLPDDRGAVRGVQLVARRPGSSRRPRSGRIARAQRGGCPARVDRGPAAPGARVTLREALSGVRWYLREVSGETAYDRYVEHLRREHPDASVMSRRDFERWRQDDRNENPRARCC